MADSSNEQVITVGIKLDAKGLQQGLALTEKQLASLGKGLTKGLNIDTTKTKGGLAELDSALKSLTQSFNAARKASEAMNNLGFGKIDKRTGQAQQLKEMLQQFKMFSKSASDEIGKVELAIKNLSLGSSRQSSGLQGPLHKIYLNFKEFSKLAIQEVKNVDNAMSNLSIGKSGGKGTLPAPMMQMLQHFKLFSQQASAEIKKVEASIQGLSLGKQSKVSGLPGPLHKIYAGFRDFSALAIKEISTVNAAISGFSMGKGGGKGTLPAPMANMLQQFKMFSQAAAGEIKKVEASIQTLSLGGASKVSGLPAPLHKLYAGFRDFSSLAVKELASVHHALNSFGMGKGATSGKLPPGLAAMLKQFKSFSKEIATELASINTVVAGAGKAAKGGKGDGANPFQGLIGALKRVGDTGVTEIQRVKTELNGLVAALQGLGTSTFTIGIAGPAPGKGGPGASGGSGGGGGRGDSGSSGGGGGVAPASTRRRGGARPGYEPEPGDFVDLPRLTGVAKTGLKNLIDGLSATQYAVYRKHHNQGVDFDRARQIDFETGRKLSQVDTGHVFAKAVAHKEGRDPDTVMVKDVLKYLRDDSVVKQNLLGLLKKDPNMLMSNVSAQESWRNAQFTSTDLIQGMGRLGQQLIEGLTAAVTVKNKSGQTFVDRERAKNTTDWAISEAQHQSAYSKLYDNLEKPITKESLEAWKKENPKKNPKEAFFRMNATIEAMRKEKDFVLSQMDAYEKKVGKENLPVNFRQTKELVSESYKYDEKGKMRPTHEWLERERQLLNEIRANSQAHWDRINRESLSQAEGHKANADKQIGSFKDIATEKDKLIENFKLLKKTIEEAFKVSPGKMIAGLKEVSKVIESIDGVSTTDGGRKRRRRRGKKGAADGETPEIPIIDRREGPSSTTAPKVTPAGGLFDYTSVKGEQPEGTTAVGPASDAKKQQYVEALKQGHLKTEEELKRHLESIKALKEEIRKIKDEEKYGPMNIRRTSEEGKSEKTPQQVMDERPYTPGKETFVPQSVYAGIPEPGRKDEAARRAEIELRGMRTGLKDSEAIFEKHFKQFTKSAQSAAEQGHGYFARYFGANLFGNMIANSIQRVQYQFVSFFQEITKYAARTEELEVVMKSLAKVNEIPGQVVTNQVQMMKSLNITTQDSLETLARFMNVGFDIKNASPLARVAQDLAVIGNKTTAEEINALVIAIQTLQSRNLRSAGVYMTVDEILDKLAATSGRARNSFTTLEKQQAVLNAVLEYGSRVAGTYDSAMETVSKQARSLDRYQKEMANNMGRELIPFYQLYVDVLTDTYKIMATYPKTIISVTSAVIKLAAAIGLIKSNLVGIMGMQLGNFINSVIMPLTSAANAISQMGIAGALTAKRNAREAERVGGAWAERQAMRSELKPFREQRREIFRSRSEAITTLNAFAAADAVDMKQLRTAASMNELLATRRGLVSQQTQLTGQQLDNNRRAVMQLDAIIGLERQRIIINQQIAAAQRGQGVGVPLTSGPGSGGILVGGGGFSAGKVGNAIKTGGAAVGGFLGGALIGMAVTDILKGFYHAFTEKDMAVKIFESVDVSRLSQAAQNITEIESISKELINYQSLTVNSQKRIDGYYTRELELKQKIAILTGDEVKGALLKTSAIKEQLQLLDEVKQREQAFQRKEIKDAGTAFLEARAQYRKFSEREKEASTKIEESTGSKSDWMRYAFGGAGAIGLGVAGGYFSGGLAAGAGAYTGYQAGTGLYDLIFGDKDAAEAALEEAKKKLKDAKGIDDATTKTLEEAFLSSGMSIEKFIQVMGVKTKDVSEVMDLLTETIRKKLQEFELQNMARMPQGTTPEEVLDSLRDLGSSVMEGVARESLYKAEKEQEAYTKQKATNLATLPEAEAKRQAELYNRAVLSEQNTIFRNALATALGDVAPERLAALGVQAQQNLMAQGISREDASRLVAEVLKRISISASSPIGTNISILGPDGKPTRVFSNTWGRIAQGYSSGTMATSAGNPLKAEEESAEYFKKLLEGTDRDNFREQVKRAREELRRAFSNDAQNAMAEEKSLIDKQIANVKQIRSLIVELTGGTSVAIADSFNNNIPLQEKFLEALNREKRVRDDIKKTLDESLEVEAEIRTLRATLSLPLVSTQLLLERELLKTTKDKQKAEQDLTVEIAAQLTKRNGFLSNYASSATTAIAQLFAETNKKRTEITNETLKAYTGFRMLSSDFSGMMDNAIISEAASQADKMDKFLTDGGPLRIEIQEVGEITQQVVAAVKAQEVWQNELTKKQIQSAKVNSDAQISTLKELEKVIQERIVPYMPNSPYKADDINRLEGRAFNVPLPGEDPYAAFDTNPYNGPLESLRKPVPVDEGWRKEAIKRKASEDKDLKKAREALEEAKQANAAAAQTLTEVRRNPLAEMMPALDGTEKTLEEKQAILDNSLNIDESVRLRSQEYDIAAQDLRVFEKKYRLTLKQFGKEHYMTELAQEEYAEAVKNVDRARAAMQRAAANSQSVPDSQQLVDATIAKWEAYDKLKEADQAVADAETEANKRAAQEVDAWTRETDLQLRRARFREHNDKVRAQAKKALDDSTANSEKRKEIVRQLNEYAVSQLGEQAPPGGWNPYKKIGEQSNFAQSIFRARGYTENERTAISGGKEIAYIGGTPQQQNLYTEKNGVFSPSAVSILNPQAIEMPGNAEIELSALLKAITGRVLNEAEQARNEILNNKKASKQTRAIAEENLKTDTSVQELIGVFSNYGKEVDEMASKVRALSAILASEKTSVNVKNFTDSLRNFYKQRASLEYEQSVLEEELYGQQQREGAIRASNLKLSDLLYQSMQKRKVIGEAILDQEQAVSASLEGTLKVAAKIQWILSNRPKNLFKEMTDYYGSYGAELLNTYEEIGKIIQKNNNLENENRLASIKKELELYEVKKTKDQKEKDRRLSILDAIKQEQKKNEERQVSALQTLIQLEYEYKRKFTPGSSIVETRTAILQDINSKMSYGAENTAALWKDTFDFAATALDDNFARLGNYLGTGSSMAVNLLKRSYQDFVSGISKLSLDLLYPAEEATGEILQAENNLLLGINNSRLQELRAELEKLMAGLAGKYISTGAYEPSTRTRVDFPLNQNQDFLNKAVGKAGELIESGGFRPVLDAIGKQDLSSIQNAPKGFSRASNDVFMEQLVILAALKKEFKKASAELTEKQALLAAGASSPKALAELAESVRNSERYVGQLRKSIDSSTIELEGRLAEMPTNDYKELVDSRFGMLAKSIADTKSSMTVDINVVVKGDVTAADSSVVSEGSGRPRVVITTAPGTQARNLSYFERNPPSKFLDPRNGLIRGTKITRGTTLALGEADLSSLGLSPRPAVAKRRDLSKVIAELQKADEDFRKLVPLLPPSSGTQPFSGLRRPPVGSVLEDVPPMIGTSGQREIPSISNLRVSKFPAPGLGLRPGKDRKIRGFKIDGDILKGLPNLEINVEVPKEKGPEDSRKDNNQQYVRRTYDFGGIGGSNNKLYRDLLATGRFDESKIADRAAIGAMLALSHMETPLFRESQLYTGMGGRGGRMQGFLQLNRNVHMPGRRVGQQEYLDYVIPRFTGQARSFIGARPWNPMTFANYISSNDIKSGWDVATGLRKAGFTVNDFDPLDTRKESNRLTGASLNNIVNYIRYGYGKIQNDISNQPPQSNLIEAFADEVKVVVDDNFDELRGALLGPDGIPINVAGTGSAELGKPGFPEIVANRVTNSTFENTIKNLSKTLNFEKSRGGGTHWSDGSKREGKHGKALAWDLGYNTNQELFKDQKRTEDLLRTLILDGFRIFVEDDHWHVEAPDNEEVAGTLYMMDDKFIVGGKNRTGYMEDVIKNVLTGLGHQLPEMNRKLRDRGGRKGARTFSNNRNSRKPLGWGVPKFLDDGFGTPTGDVNPFAPTDNFRDSESSGSRLIFSSSQYGRTEFAPKPLLAATQAAGLLGTNLDSTASSVTVLENATVSAASAIDSLTTNLFSLSGGLSSGRFFGAQGSGLRLESSYDSSKIFNFNLAGSRTTTTQSSTGSLLRNLGNINFSSILDRVGESGTGTALANDLGILSGTSRGNLDTSPEALLGLRKKPSYFTSLFDTGGFSNFLRFAQQAQEEEKKTPAETGNSEKTLAELRGIYSTDEKGNRTYGGYKSFGGLGSGLLRDILFSAGKGDMWKNIKGNLKSSIPGFMQEGLGYLGGYLGAGSKTGGILGSIGSLVGGAFASSIASGAFAAGGSGFLGMTSLATAIPVVGALAGGLMLTTWLFGRAARRKQEKELINKNSEQVIKDLKELLESVQNNKTDGESAAKQADELKKQFEESLAKIKTSPGKDLKRDKLAEVDALVMQIKGAATDQKVRKETDEKIIATYNTGGISKGGPIKVSRGETLFIPTDKGDFGSEDLAGTGIPGYRQEGSSYKAIKIPGGFDRKDDIAATVPAGTVIATPAQIKAMQIKEAMEAKQLQEFSTGGVAWFDDESELARAPKETIIANPRRVAKVAPVRNRKRATRGVAVQGGSTAQPQPIVQPPAVNAIIVMSPEEAENLAKIMPGSIIVSKVRTHVNESGVSGLAGDILNTFTK